MGRKIRRVFDITRRNPTSIIFILTRSHRSICLGRLDFMRAISNDSRIPNAINLILRRGWRQTKVWQPILLWYRARPSSHRWRLNPLVYTGRYSTNFPRTCLGSTVHLPSSTTLVCSVFSSSWTTVPTHFACISITRWRMCLPA